MIGTALAHYRVLERLGSGGMGEVYRARDERLERDVALKVVRADAFADATARARLLREARTASSLNHPNICVIHEVGEHEGRVFVIMELIEGRTLAQAIAERRVSHPDALRLGIELADALAHAHERGVIHRDVKSSNVILTDDGRAKILDFGVARRLAMRKADGADLTVEALTEVSLAGPSDVVGTLSYLPPEVLRGEPAGPASDLWSLGVVFYEAATGRRPYDGRTSFELTASILYGGVPPLPPEVPWAFAAVIERCLQKDPRERFASARELRAALEEAAAGAKGAAPDPSRIRSVVVLPLANLSGDSAQDLFVDGMTDELIAGLAKLGSLRVISRTTAMRFKGTARTLPEIARELNVEAVLEGSVRRAGERVRINVELVHAASDTHLWAESYERDLQDVFALQSEVARAVAQEIRLQLSTEARERLAPARAIPPEAFEAYLRGRHYLGRRTEDSVRRATEEFRKAIDLDPGYALAHAGLADSYNIAGYYMMSAPADTFPLAKAAAEQALAIQPQLAEGVAALAYTQFYGEWDFKSAEANFRRAIELNPSYASAYQYYGNLLAIRGRYEEAKALLRRARDLDPLSLIITAALGWTHLYGHQYDEAIRTFRRALELDQGFLLAHIWMGRALTAKGLIEEASQEFDEAVALSPDSPHTLAFLGEFYGKTGRREEALGVIETMRSLAGRRYMPAVATAIVYAGLGETERALEWLERAHEGRENMVLFTPVDPAYDSLRAEPRFLDIARKIELLG